MRKYFLIIPTFFCAGIINGQGYVNVSNPRNNSFFSPNSSITLSATVVDTVSSITQVTFYNSPSNSIVGNGTLSGSVYSFTWNSVPIGNYPVYAVALDSLGNILTSPTINIVVDSNSLPWYQGGNSFGTTGIFGTNDSNGISIRTNGAEKAFVTTTGGLRLNKYLNDANGDSVLSTDTSGNLLFKFLPSNYVFDNGLGQNDSEVYLGGNISTGYLNLQIFQEDFSVDSPTVVNSFDSYNWNSPTTSGLMAIESFAQYYNSAGSDAQISTGSNDIFQNTGFPQNSNFLLTAGGWNNNETSNSMIYGVADADFATIQMSLADSVNQNGNGMALYSNYMSLNEPTIQLPYFLNDSAGDQILTTDTLGNMVLKPFSSFLSGTGTQPGNYVFDNGLSQNDSEVFLGGTITNPYFELQVAPQDLNENGQTVYSSLTSGYARGKGQNWYLNSFYVYDSLGAGCSLETSAFQGFILRSSYGDPTESANASITGNSTSGASLSLTAVDSINNSGNGINIFSSYLQLYEPSVQLPYYLNDSTQDSVLVTDQYGNLQQKAFSSFGSNSGRWNWSGSYVYDTLDYIGIGTNTPQSLLSVAGTITSKQVVVTQTGWPDFVFKPTYPLMPLKKVEQYIKLNRHLPGITSASEVEKKGLDLGSSQAELLKKIEELTLYLIDQEKKNKDQECRIKALEEKVDLLIKMNSH